MKEFKVIEEYSGTYCEECGERLEEGIFTCEVCETDEFIEDRAIKSCEECGVESEVIWDERTCPACNKTYF